MRVNSLSLPISHHAGAKNTKASKAFLRVLRVFVANFHERQVGLRLGILLLLALGVVLRLGRLAWQPLWADEGYSVYFATEAVPRLLWLTAHDIHPPLYYLLLQQWIKVWTTPDPVLLRLFSILLAIPALCLGAALAQMLFNRRRPQLLFLVLLLFNPMYLYYSQEVRMYGLALTLSMASTLCCWQWAGQDKTRKAASRWLAAYVVIATLALYTLYYLAFLLLAHWVWVNWTLRKQGPSLRRFWLAAGLIALLYLPWVIYTARVLVSYVNDKVRSDQDVAVGPGVYLLRHILAFTGGHLSLPAALAFLPWLALVISMGLLLWSLRDWLLTTGSPLKPSAQTMLWLCFVIPFVAAFLVNCFYPFFPVGGERLLLFVLPYFLLLLAGALAELWQPKSWAGRIVGGAGFLLLLTTAAVGVWVFYTLPRYPNDDYRPLIRQVVQQGSDADTVLATFPWQVGFWRAYAPQTGLPAAAGPHLQLLSDRAVLWGPAVAARLDEALARGLVWIPTLRSIGSALPIDIDNYLTGRAVNFVHRWSSATTQLDAWHRPAALTMTPVAVDWGDVKLVSGGVSATTLPAANYPLEIELHWQSQATLPAYGVTLRLQSAGQSWANRDYDKIGTFVTKQAGDLLVEQVGLLVPAGLPPGAYQLVIGLVGADQEVRKPIKPTDPAASLLPLATLTITAPTAPLPPFRLPIQFPLPQPVASQGVALLGYSGGDTVLLAGTALELTLFWQKQAAPVADQNLYLSLLDADGASVAGWEGWPLPDYPFAHWPAGALVQTPAAVLVPATVVSGTYRLVAGLLDPTTGAKQPPIMLGVVAVHQRTANFTPTQPPLPLPHPVQFGTHVQLLGYDLHEQGEQMTLALYWQVLQPLLPPHQIFVHLDKPDGGTLAQTDGTPRDASGLAPTGSWQPGEYLVTHHTLTTAALTEPTTILRIGLYVPTTGARLPLSIAGAPAGDALVLPRK